MAAKAMTGLTRRKMVQGLGAVVATPAVLGRVLFTPARASTKDHYDPGPWVADAKLSGTIACAVADMKTGAILGGCEADRPMPPASTAKTITSLYALDRLGRDFRFATRLVATGPVAGGVLQGDLVLAGGGDPSLTTDDLGDMVQALVAKGVTSVAGRFLVWGGALPYLRTIDADQPAWLGYSPAVGGLNLNFNRVNFTWKRAGDGYDLAFDARADRFAPQVTMARAAVVDRDHPTFDYTLSDESEDWTVSRAALGREGSRWLPVRRPDLYAGDVFRTLAQAAGLRLAAPEAVADLPAGTVLVQHQSAELPDLLRAMMKHSNNMMAETVGMTASAMVGANSHAASARAMCDWLAAKLDGVRANFVDHSGLGGASRVSAAQMVSALVRLGPDARLAELMKDVRLAKASDLGVEALPKRVVAKTGTLNFVSGLVGYLDGADGTSRAFAIYSADVQRRDSVPPEQREHPQGGRAWLGRARRLQMQLLGSWA